MLFNIYMFEHIGLQTGDGHIGSHTNKKVGKNDSGCMHDGRWECIKSFILTVGEGDLLWAISYILLSI